MIDTKQDPSCYNKHPRSKNGTIEREDSRPSGTVAASPDKAEGGGRVDRRDVQAVVERAERDARLAVQEASSQTERDGESADDEASEPAEEDGDDDPDPADISAVSSQRGKGKERGEEPDPARARTGTHRAQRRTPYPSILRRTRRIRGRKNFVLVGEARSKPERTPPQGYILDWFVSTSEAFALTERWLTGWNDDSQRLFRHVLANGTLSKKRDRWVPLAYDLIHGRRTHGWEGKLPDADEHGLVAAGLLERVKGIERFQGGKSAEYRVPAELQARYDDALGRGRFVNLFTGKATTRKAKTSTYDENRNPYPSLIREGMEGVRFGLYHRPSAEAHVERSKALAEAAECKAAALLGADSSDPYENARTVREGATILRMAEEDGIEPPFDAETVKAIEEAERLRGRFSVDNAVLFALKRQTTEELVGGVCRYRTAYDPQAFGRITDKGGGLQNGTSEMKAACWDPVPKVCNYDIVSSQPSQLEGWFVRAGLPTDELRDVLLGDKEAVSLEVGITRGAWKGATMALVIGGILWKSLDTATDRRGRYRGEVPKIIADGVRDGWTASDAYDAFAARLSKLYGQLKALRRWLVNAWLAEHEYTADSGRRYVKNATGAVFCVSDFERESGGYKPSLGRKLLAFLLQGAEAAFIYTLTVLQDQYGYAVIGNEHDGLVTVGKIPAEAVETAREYTGVDSARLETKPFKKAA